MRPDELVYALTHIKTREQAKECYQSILNTFYKYDFRFSLKGLSSLGVVMVLTPTRSLEVIRYQCSGDIIDFMFQKCCDSMIFMSAYATDSKGLAGELIRIGGHLVYNLVSLNDPQTVIRTISTANKIKKKKKKQ